MIRITDKDPYTAVGNIIEEWCEKSREWGDMLVTLEIDGYYTTEILEFSAEDGFIWFNDWYEGQREVYLCGFTAVDNVRCFSYGERKYVFYSD